MNYSDVQFGLKISKFISVTSKNDLSRESGLRNWLRPKSTRPMQLYKLMVGKTQFCNHDF